MMEREVKNLLSFALRAYRLKHEPRRGWISKAGIELPESVADHSWATALLAILLCKELDTGKLVQLCIIHDLAEAVIGDKTPEDKVEKGLEKKAIRSLTTSLPRGIKSRLEGLWREFVQGTSKEAVLARQLDKLEMALQARLYADEGYEPSKLRPFLDSALLSIYDERLRQVLSQLKL